MSLHELDYTRDQPPGGQESLSAHEQRINQVQRLFNAQEYLLSLRQRDDGSWDAVWIPAAPTTRGAANRHAQGLTRLEAAENAWAQYSARAK
jgi:hypothetical protein